VTQQALDHAVGGRESMRRTKRSAGLPMTGAGRWLAAVLTAVVAAGLAGCSLTGVGGSRLPDLSRVRAPQPAVRARRRAVRVGRPIVVAGRPTVVAGRPGHVVVVVEENHAFEQIIGSPAAPFLNHLAARGTLLTDYHAVTHPSLPNYLALLSGRTGRIHSDCQTCTMAGPTLVDELEADHISWAAYFQGLPRPCSLVAQAGPYSEAINPFMHAARVRDNPSRCHRILPFGRFHADLVARRLPTVVFVIPDLDHDMHSGPVPVADVWLHRLVAELAAAPVWGQDTRLVVTFDESQDHDGRSCCGGLGRGGRVATIIAGPGVPPGRDPTPYTHYSLLRSVEAAYGLRFLDHAGDPATATIPALAHPAQAAT
jgi:phospholipase C